MATWPDTLVKFSAVIRMGGEFGPGEVVCPSYPEVRGIEVYRNNYRGNLHDALAAAYPVIRQLVGEDFFRLLAKRYIESYPSRSGNLHRYGDEMSEFLTHFEPAKRLAYLPDVAQLEWAYHRAYFAEGAPLFDINRLTTIHPEVYAGLCWRLHPGCSLLNSAYPIASIWQAHQDGSPADFQVNLNQGGDSLLVYRNELGVEIFRLAPASAHWLAQLQQGTAMGEATEGTLAAYPDFDLATTLHHWLAQGVLHDFDIIQVEKS